MLTRWTRNSARLLDIRLEPNRPSCLVDDDDTYLVDVGIIATVLFPSPDAAWKSMAGTLSPMYSKISSLISEDAQNLAGIISGLEASGLEDIEEGDDETLPINVNASVIQNSFTNAEKLIPCRTRQRIIPRASCRQGINRKRRRSPSPNDNLTLIHPSTHPSVPTVIISPAPPQNRETSCWVPLQNSQFSNRLTVPLYHCINDSHPPLIRPNQHCHTNRHTGHPPLAAVDHWEYQNGHWEAVLPTLVNQIQRGLFSRPIIQKRRVHLPANCLERSLD